MKIRNKRKGFNKVNYRVNGVPRSVGIPAGATVDIPGLKRTSDILNFRDFKTGFFEIVEEAPVVPEKKIEEKKTELDEAVEKVEEYSKKKSESSRTKKKDK
jgi:hypothetical protein